MGERMYCWICHEETEAKCQLISKAVVSGPIENQHPAEYSDYYCSHCGSTAISEYKCEKCGETSSSPPLMECKGDKLLCHYCAAEREISEAMSDLSEHIVRLLVDKYEFIDNTKTRDYAEEIIKDYLERKPEVSK
jgi:methionyl-tRNA synthetase